MALRPVPWAIGNGAENSVELARAVAFIGSSGSTGVVDPVDFGVTQLPTPGAAVRVKLGTGVIRNTYPGVVGQSYVVQEQSFTDVPVAATGSAGGATKYVYVLITDTQYGGQNPPSVENGPYNEYAVTTTLPKNQPYLLLAKIVQPASTATITNAMLTDMRELAMPKREQLMFGRPRIASDAEPNYSTQLKQKVSTGGEYFPGGNGAPNTFKVDVPEWATRIIIDAAWMSVRYGANVNPFGEYWIEYGDEYRDRTWPGKQQWEFATQHFMFNSPGKTNDSMRMDWRLMSSQHMPAKLRGKTITFAFKAGRSDSGGSADVLMDSFGGLGMHIAFVQTSLDPKSNEDPI